MRGVRGEGRKRRRKKGKKEEEKEDGHQESSEWKQGTVTKIGHLLSQKLETEREEKEEKG